jgi:hypothetical protein
MEDLVAGTSIAFPDSWLPCIWWLSLDGEPLKSFERWVLEGVCGLEERSGIKSLSSNAGILKDFRS